MTRRMLAPSLLAIIPLLSAMVRAQEVPPWPSFGPEAQLALSSVIKFEGAEKSNCPTEAVMLLLLGSRAVLNLRSIPSAPKDAAVQGDTDSGDTLFRASVLQDHTGKLFELIRKTCTVEVAVRYVKSEPTSGGIYTPFPPLVRAQEASPGLPFGQEGQPALSSVIKFDGAEERNCPKGAFMLLLLGSRAEVTYPSIISVPKDAAVQGDIDFGNSMTLSGPLPDHTGSLFRVGGTTCAVDLTVRSVKSEPSNGGADVPPPAPPAGNK
jgi:hypothetical protein